MVNNSKYLSPQIIKQKIDHIIHVHSHQPVIYVSRVSEINNTYDEIKCIAGFQHVFILYCITDFNSLKGKESISNINIGM